MSLTLQIAALAAAALGGAGVAALVCCWLRRSGGEGELQVVVARETLQRLHALANRVAVDVGEHSHRVERINADLSAAQGGDAAILAAVAQLIDANEQMQQRLNSAEQRLKAQARQIESQSVEARTDPLTQLANRRALDDAMRRAVVERHRANRPATLMLFDVDHFKRFNDTHGHQAGDEVLRGASRILRETLVEADIVARYGGEEFAVVLGGSSLEEVVERADAARAAIAAAIFRWKGKPLRVTMSVGVAGLGASEGDAELLRRADEALYASKKAGRNCGHWNDGQANHRIVRSTPTMPAGRTSQVKQSAASIAGPTAAPSSEFVGHLVDRAAFVRDVANRLDDRKLHPAPVSLIALQIDGFERLVQEHGHAAGPTMMRILAQLTMATLHGHDQATRLSDRVYAVLFPALHGADAAAAAERLRQSVERCRLTKQAGVPKFTISVGVAEAAATDDATTLVLRAREALAKADDNGANSVRFAAAEDAVATACDA